MPTSQAASTSAVERVQADGKSGHFGDAEGSGQSTVQELYTEDSHPLEHKGHHLKPGPGRGETHHGQSGHLEGAASVERVQADGKSGHFDGADGSHSLGTGAWPNTHSQA